MDGWMDAARDGGWVWWVRFGDAGVDRVGL